MPAMKAVVDGALADVLGQTQTLDSTTYLTQPLSESGLVLTVANASQFSRGLVQVGDELMLVDSVDRDKGTLKVGALAGRGVRGSIVLAHATGDVVTMSPTVPRHRAVEAVNDTIATCGLYRVDVEEHTFRSAQSGYVLPEAADAVLNVSWFPTGPSQQWLDVRRWRFDKFNSLVVIADPITSGRPLRITYAADPLPVTDPLAEFTDTGLRDAAVDAIRLGAAWRLSAHMEPSAVTAVRAESDAMDRGKNPGSRLQVSRYYYGLYQQRVAEELQWLQSRYPIKTGGIW